MNRTDFRFPREMEEYGRMTFADLFGDALVESVPTTGSLTFQAAGDTGVGTQDQENVSIAMSRDLNRRDQGPLFFMNLGDIIYGPRKNELYSSNRSYRPYLNYIQAPLTYVPPNLCL